MLSTLLCILKIVCIVVLVILGLILSMLFLVLFVPVRYRFLCSYNESFSARVKVTWLFHLLSVLATYDQSFQLSVRILGFPLGGSGKEEEEESEREEDGGSEKGEEDEAWEREESGACVQEPEGKEPCDETASDRVSKGSADGKESSADIREISADMGEDSAGEGKSPSDGKESGGKRKRKKSSSSGGIFKKIKFRFQSFRDKVRAVKEKEKKIHGFLTDPANKKSFRHLLRMVKHILPRKLTGSVKFGFEDPSVTGKVTALCSLAYARYGDSLQITPMFEEQVLDAQVKGKGRMFLGAELFWCLRVLMNKNFRELIFKRRRKKDGGE